MKRILSLFIILVLVLGTLAACQPKEATSNEADIQQAYKQVEDMYKKYNGTAIPNGEELIAQVKIEKTVFTITWTSSNENVKVELNDGLYVVTLPKDVTEQSEYTLTATIKSEGGQEAKYEIKTVLTASYGMITNPEVGKAYKLALLHGNEGPAVVYFDGANYKSYSYYLNYTKDILSAVDVYLEAVEGVEGGLRLYFEKDGVKTYISGCPRSDKPTQGSLEFVSGQTPTSYWTYSTEYNTLVCNNLQGVEEFYMGSSGNYTSISASSTSYITGATNYPCRFYGVGGVEEVLPEQNLPELPENPTVSDILNAAEQLLVGQKLEVNFEITGVITSFKYAFDASYNNVSPIIEVNGKKITCFRIAGTGMDTIKVGDTITVFVSGVNRQSSSEISTLEGGVIRNVVPGTESGEQGGTNTAADILNTLYALADGETATGTYTLTGKITELDSYNNPTIVVEGFEDKPVYCYKLVVDKAVGDVITVTATTLKNFGGTYEFMNCTLVENGGNGQPSTPTYTAPEVNKPYYITITIPAGKYYFKGVKDSSNKYLDTTTDENAAVQVYFEETTGGYHIYFMVGDAKTYINTTNTQFDSKGNMKSYLELGTEPNCVWTYNTELGILEVSLELDGQTETFFPGTYTNTSSNTTYSTISLSSSYYKAQLSSGNQHPARIELADGTVTPPSTDDGDDNEGSGTTPPAGDEDGNEDGVMTHAEYLAVAKGGSVCIKGYVSYKSGTNTFLVDAEGNGYYLFGSAVDATVGEEIIVTGTQDIFNNLYEVKSFTYTKTGNTTTVAPVDYTETLATNGLNVTTELQNKLVTFTGTLTANKTITVGDKTVALYYKNSSSTTEPAIGTEVTVIGVLSVYNSNSQVLVWNQDGLKAAEHTCEGEYPCSSTCKICSQPVTAADHTYEDGFCVCGKPQPSAGQTTVTVSIADYAAANSWANSTKYTSITLDSNIKVTAAGGSYTGKYYTNGENWRIYKSETGTVNVTATSGTIVSVKITYESYQGGYLTLSGEKVESGQIITVNDSSITFGVDGSIVDNKGETKQGQARITSIEVIYQ